MKANIKHQTSNIKHIVGSLSRTLLAITFLFSGFVKAVDPLGTVYKIEDYLKAFGGFFTDLLPLAGVAAVCLIAAEWLLGICMFANIRTQWTSWISLAFYLVMTPLTLWIALTNPVSDCGCFGDALVLTNWQTFWKNIVLLSLVIVLLVCRKAIPQTFSWWAEIVIAGIGLGALVSVMCYSYNHLPPMDFRPYKIGNHIPTLMEIPEDAEPDILVKKGYEAPIHDFEIMTMDFEDITYDILESEEAVTLIAMYDLKKTDLKQIDKVKALLESNQPCYLLTGSGEEEIENFCMEHGIDEQSFCTIDPVTLKTVVRANPGVFVVQNGTIIDKYNLRNY